MEESPGKLFVPGERIIDEALAKESLPSYTRNGVRRSSAVIMLGDDSKNEPKCQPATSIQYSSIKRFFPEYSDIVYAVVTGVFDTYASLSIKGFHKRDKPDERNLIHHEMNATISTNDATFNKIPLVFIFQVGDIVRGSAISRKPGSIRISTKKADEGVWLCFCPNCNGPLSMLTEWTLACLPCKHLAHRKVSLSYSQET